MSYFSLFFIITIIIMIMILDACLYSNEKTVVLWVGRWGESMRSLGKGNCNQNILYKNNLFSIFKKPNKGLGFLTSSHSCPHPSSSFVPLGLPPCLYFFRFCCFPALNYFSYYQILWAGLERATLTCRKNPEPSNSLASGPLSLSGGSF